MSANSLALIVLSVTLSAIAQIAFKFGVSLPPAISAQSWLGPLAVFTKWGVLVGLSLYGVGTLIWLKALSRVEVSQAYPFVGLGFVLTTAAGWWFFGDKLTGQRLIGISLVLSGIVVLSRT
jgi:multidrug transporter EmrE-like cation transporter